MACPDLATLADLADGALDEPQAAAVEEHLSVCGKCRRLVSEVARRIPAEGGAQPPPAPASPAEGEARCSDDGALVDAAERTGSSASEQSASPGGEPTRGIAEGSVDRAAGDRTLLEWFQHPAALFSAGQLVGGRYRVLGVLGSGGMGTVFEAEDLELHERVAVKVLAAARGDDPIWMRRLRREVQLARKVSHENVCRVFDIGFHDLAERGDQGARAGRRVPFLSMELLAGETLASRLRREGRFSTEAALLLVRQMASALEAAHRAGVVHGDFKSANVMLVPGRGGGEAPRAVVTDFGLARGALPPAAAGGPSQGDMTFPDGGLVGSPAYMAPEQVEGARPEAAADIYALGVVMYEMLCGALPFVGPSPLQTALRRLVAPPAPLRTRVPDLDRGLEALVLRCLARDPKQRFASMGELCEALSARSQALGLGGTGATGETPAGRPWSGSTARVRLMASMRRRPRGRMVVLAAGAALAVVVTALAWQAGPWRRHATHPGSSTRGGRAGNGQPQPLPGKAGRDARAGEGPSVRPARGPRRSVAVLGIRNLSGRPELAWMATAIAEDLSAELAAGGELRVCSGEDVSRFVRDQRLGETDLDAPSSTTLARLRANLHADLVVTGSYRSPGGKAGEKPGEEGGKPAGGETRLEVRLREAGGGLTVTAVTESGRQDKLPDLVARVGRRLRERLGLAAVSAAEQRQVRASHPASVEATRLYAEGLARLRLGEAQAGRRLLEQAVAADPGFALAHEALSRALESIGYQKQAQDEARRAFDQSSGLPEPERLAIEARCRELAGDWPRAIEIHRALLRSAPEPLEPGLRLVRTQLAAGRATEARATLQGLRPKLSPEEARDPRLDLLEARICEALGELGPAKEAYARAAARGQMVGARLLLAEVRRMQGSVLLRMGEVRQALSAAREAHQIYGEASEHRGLGNSLRLEGAVAEERGDQKNARRLYLQALAVGRQTGDRASMARSLLALAILCHNLGKLDEAKRFTEETLAIERDLQDPRSLGPALSLLGRILATQNRLAEAAPVAEEALALARSTADEYAVTSTLGELALVRLWQGELSACDKLAEEMLTIARRIQAPSKVATARYLQGEVAFVRGDLARARAAYEESLSLRESMGDQVSVAEVGSRLADTFVEQGNGVAAEPRLRETLSRFRALGLRDRESQTRVDLVHALLLQGRLAEAERELARAKAAARGNVMGDPDSILSSSLRRARASLLAARGKVEQAKREIATVVADARAGGSVFNEMSYRLDAGKIGLAGDARSRAEGRAQLEALAQEADAKGFGLTARQAREALGRTAGRRSAP